MMTGVIDKELMNIVGAESIATSKRKMGTKSRLDTNDSDSKGSDSYENENVEKQRHKKSDKHKRDCDETSDSDSQNLGQKGGEEKKER